MNGLDHLMFTSTETTRKKSRRRNGDGNTYRYKNGWSGTIIIDNKPVLSDQSEVLFFAKAVRGPNGAVDFQASAMNWIYPENGSK